MKYYNQAWDILLNEVGTYEFKDMIAAHASDAIELKDMSMLLKPITTFDPDLPGDGLETYSAEAVADYVKKTGIMQFVQNNINT